MQQEALGMVETKGLVSAIEAADKWENWSPYMLFHAHTLRWKKFYRRLSVNNNKGY